MMTPAHKPGPMQVLIRGDLCSNTGYARANRALAGLLGLSVTGADIHPDPHDGGSRPDFPLVTDQVLFNMAQAAERRPLVLHCTSPDAIRHFPGAINVGAFYWETDAIPHRRDWPLKLSMLDRIWAPTRFVAGFARAAGYRGPIDLVPWAHSFPPRDETHRAPPPAIDVRFVAAAEGNAVAPLTLQLGALRKQARRLFLAVQSLAPRKGTRTLLREWRTYQQQSGGAEAGRDVLVLRLAFRHSTDIDGPPMQHFARMLRAAGFRPGDRVNIALVIDAMPAEALRGLYRCCDAFVTASFGEGFGGPVIEALQEGCLVIAPRHTGLADLLPDDYPLVVQSRRVVTGLAGNLDVYPASASWNIPEPGSIATAMARAATFTEAQRQDALGLARAHAIGFCSIPVVRQRIVDALGAIEAVDRAAAPTGARATA